MDRNFKDFQAEIRGTLARIEAKLDMVLGGVKPATSHTNVSADVVQFAQFTTKQHAIIQMLMRDANAEEIAERLKVKATTVRTHLTMIASKLGAQRRSSIISILSPIYARISEEAYVEASGGLPKHWDRDYDPSDEINKLVVNKADLVEG